jgi:NAD(P)-dependent dehydrogenase (short-subunit alcohol dehydrogenase family)
LTILIASSRKSSGRRGKLDIVFANAGVAKYARLGAITEEFYDSIFNINVKGLLFTVQNALPLMPDGGSIILNASIVASKGLSSNSVYSATKAAVRSFARTWTTDLTRIAHGFDLLVLVRSGFISNFRDLGLSDHNRSASITAQVPNGGLGADAARGDLLVAT